MAQVRAQSTPARLILPAALALGLITGLVEGLSFIVLQKLNWLTVKIGLIDVSPDILWFAVVFDVIFFFVAGVGMSAVNHFLRRPLVFKLAIFVLCFLMLFDWATLALFGRIRLYAVAVITLGLSVQATRMFLKYQAQLFRIWRPTVILLALVTAVLGITIRLYVSTEERRAIQNLPPHKSGSPNVVLIVVDALRADHLSAYGYRRPTSPNIDRLAAGGVLFQNAFSASSWTLPSHVSLLTGRYPTEHKADWSDPTALRDGNLRTIAEALKNNGYRTAGFSGNLYWVTHQFGIDRGFLHFEDYFHSFGDMVLRTIYGRAIENGILTRLGFEDIPARKRAAQINESVLKWVARDPEKPFFVFINYMDVHDPYLPLQPYRKKFASQDEPGGILNWRIGRSDPQMTAQQLEDEISAYDGAISYVDEHIGKLVAALKSQGDPVVIITSDHGESFGEHNLYLHGHSLYSGEIHVPLIVNYPKSVPANTTIEQPVSNVSVPTTLMSLVGAEPVEFPGRSLSVLWQGTEQKTNWPSPISYVAQQLWISPKLPVQHGNIQSIVTGEWHYIENAGLGVELYRWKEDRRELNNLARREETQDLIRALRAELVTASNPPSLRAAVGRQKPGSSGPTTGVSAEVARVEH